MATTTYFEETIKDQGGKKTMDVEFGRSSYYAEESIYLNINGEGVIMDRATGEKFVKAIITLGHYHGFVK